MWLSSLCYFWNFVDTKIVYRKHLGLIGFAFGIAHTALSYTALQRLFQLVTWQKGAMWPALSATVAMIIFTVMALISNKYAAHELGGIWWRRILRLGHVALILVWAHVVLLKGQRWVTWWTEGPKTLPAMSLIVSIFIGVIIVMRLALWWSLWRKKRVGQNQ
jgi:DMSO/TMAO reductase YedYZ heme-binding membrane subunit